MQFILTAWGRWRTHAFAALAFCFIGGEALVTAGFPLPFSESIPVWARGLVTALVVAGGVYFKANPPKDDDGDKPA